ncbi:MAG: hypothetical protein L6R36_002547 [Xanthoria steineri]|nr:MAG: hypothetical protein L6R36_002547 [Xanthoria steineri]
MAPLTELSVNRPATTRQISLNGFSTNSGKGQPASLSLSEQPSSLPAASSIQSMLKNTTELGDIGSYITKATKLPRQRSTTIGRSRDYHHHRPRAPYPADHAPGNHASQRHYHQPPYNHSERSLRHNPSLGTSRDHSLTSDTQDQRSDSLTQSSSLNSRRLSVHPSLRSIRPCGHPAPRPRSPLAYPSRLKRPGYRPSSPAFSELNRSDSALHTTVQRAYSTRTISPNSTSSQRRAPAVWNHAFNRSDPLLYHHQALPLSRRHDGNRSPPFVRRGPLRRSPLGSHRSSIIIRARPTPGSGSSSEGELAPSSPPLFYDYSEAFEKESFHHTAKRASLFAARSTPQSDGSSEGYQTDVTNTSNTFAKYSNSSTENKAITPERNTAKVEQPSSSRLISSGPKQDLTERDKDSLGTNLELTVSQVLPITPLEEQSVATSGPDGVNPPSEQLLELSTSASKRIDPFTLTPASHNELRYPSSAYNPTPKVVKTATVSMRLSSSSSGSQYSTSVHSKQGQTTNHMAVQVPTMAYERQPKALSVSFNRLEDVHHAVADIELQQRAASLDTRLRPDPCQIFAPVPERSMSSRDSRDRFSRIFSISDDLAKRDLFTGALPNKKAPMTIQQYLRDKKGHSPNGNPTTTKELPSLPYDSSPVTYNGKGRETDEALAILSANEKPKEVSKLPDKDHDVPTVSAWERLAALSGLARPGIPPRYSSISRHSTMDQPGPSHSVRDSILSQKPSIEQQSRMFPLTKRNSSLAHAMKELPPLPLEPVIPIPPPQTPSPLELPYRFTPLMPQDWLDTAVADIRNSAKIDRVAGAKKIAEQENPNRTLKTALSFEPAPTASPASARPWNLDASYPWVGTPPKFEVSVPQTTEDRVPDVQKLPSFRRNFRRSLNLGNGGKLIKNRPSNIKPVHLPATTSNGMTPVQTRFTEGHANVQSAAPSIALVPPSPGLKIEAQSFFSDDSSQKRRKGSLRRRFSQIRGMAMRTASTDDIRGLEKGRSTSALGRSGASKRSSKQTLTNPNVKSRYKSRKWSILDKVKSWFQRHEDKIKLWRSRFATRQHQNHPISANL